jgi:hypothetical protein
MIPFNPKPLTFSAATESFPGPTEVNPHHGVYTVVRYDEQVKRDNRGNREVQVVATLKSVENAEVNVIWSARNWEKLNLILLVLGPMPKSGCLVEVGAERVEGVYQPKLYPTTVSEQVFRLIEEDGL